MNKRIKNKLSKRQAQAPKTPAAPKAQAPKATAPKAEAPKAQAPVGKLNINTATLEEMVALNGIGANKAKAIVEYREQNGAFATVEDLRKVSGIGPALVETLSSQVYAG